MHDLDRAMFEADETETGTADEQEYEEFLADLQGASRNGTGTWRSRAGRRPRYGAPAGDTDMASQLLDVQSEEELDQFLGDLVSRAAGAVKDFAGSKTGEALTGVLKKAAGSALPILGGAAGGYFGQEKLGQTAGGALRGWLGWELEGLSDEDREFEIAKAFTRFATAAARQAARAPADASPQAVARSAAISAAQRYAPALLEWLRGGGGRGQQVSSETSAYESDEAEAEIEAAGRLLEITSEEELEEFLGNWIRTAAKTVGKVVRSPVGQALGGALKGIARRALPVVGGAVGSFVAPGAGTAIGSALGSAAARMFELELESMDEQEAEFEVARRVVRLASAAAKNAARAPRGAPPQAVAQAAIRAAARRHAPGLVSGRPGRPNRPGGPGRPKRRRPYAPGSYGFVVTQGGDGGAAPPDEDDDDGDRCRYCGAATGGDEG
jgi:uncharacterized protein (DUF697 family)